MSRPLALAPIVFTSVFLASNAFASTPIEVENDKPVDATIDSWMPPLDPTTWLATTIGVDGVIDGYPSKWSVRNGETIGLRVSTTSSSFRTRVYRIGWYAHSSSGGPVGSRLVYEIPSTAGERQPFPGEDADRGLAEAKWHDSVSFTIPCDWTTGAYVVRFTTNDGKDAYTYFLLRDDTRTSRAPILYVDTSTTAQAYNPWPKMLDASGKQILGKSTYAYNSAGVATKASGEPRAVAVSYDRPYGENWGLGIFRDWGIPMIQWLEMNGYDVTYAESRDLDAGAVIAGRRMIMDSGHDEYWSAGMWDQIDRARDAGINVAFFSGNDFTWQVRFEAGSAGDASTMVTYKGAAYPRPTICGTCSDWGGDPEFQLALAAKKAGDTTSQVTHLKNVTYAWSALSDFDPTTQKFVDAPVDVARYAMEIEGLFGGPKLPDCAAGAKPTDPCNGLDWVIENETHWIYTGAGVPGGVATGVAKGDRLPKIVGYEMDSAYVGSTYSMRPKTQLRLAWNDQGSYTGYFNAQYYDASSGAKVFSAGTINWAWGLPRGDLGQWESFALDATVGSGKRLDDVVGGITTNVVNMMSAGSGSPIAPPAPPTCADVTPPVDAGASDAGSDTATSDAGAHDAGPIADAGRSKDAGTDGNEGIDDDAAVEPQDAGARDASLVDAPNANDDQANVSSPGAGCGCDDAGRDAKGAGAIGAILAIFGGIWLRRRKAEA